ncbi:type VI secretion system baseplate subunit TssF [Amaricoccus sp.]|uniref:type VI secretion system baseplate subunit TssF n=1 Tax=Amaricoccus sp. TaxID=1872485 RepID=UPI001B5F484D|nr:type VI secretion system baseplate subunit TssF [Amaricoccus sp.]MBP7000308.1 type VI secretion system baseplate subunit TssF [Amaricoccus sp.]
MDRVFLEYYEDELAHLRRLAVEFADLHPSVARNLSLDTVPCPDPYVERLLEGVAWLAARTRLRLDGEASRFARATLDALYPDLVAPGPAVGLVTLRPGRQVQGMAGGHVVARGARLVAGLRPGLATRATYVTAQDVTLWPLEIAGCDYVRDRAGLAAAGIAAPGAEAALRVTLARVGPGSLAELALDRLDLHFRGHAPALFDALYGAVVAVGARPAGGAPGPLAPAGMPEMVGIADAEALLPRTRAGFEGYRLLREYFLMPERFHFVRVAGLGPAVRRSDRAVELAFLLRRPAPELADVTPGDLGLFVTPVVNLFERDCDVIDVDPRRTRQVLHADRTRARDFEICRVLKVEDADADGPSAELPALFGLAAAPASGWMHSAERRPRRPAEDERRQGQLRSSYAGDDVFLSLSRPPGAAGRPLRRLAVRALCSNRDLALLDDSPALTLDSGDPVEAVSLIGTLRPPRPSLAAAPPRALAGETRADELAWRLVAQLSLDFLGLAEGPRGAEPLRALVGLYADRGDQALAAHARALARVEARPVLERLPLAGPMCFGRGTEVTLTVDEAALAGHAALLLPAVLAQLFARYAAINAFVRTRIRLVQRQEEAAWPMTPGRRPTI